MNESAVQTTKKRKDRKNMPVAYFEFLTAESQYWNEYKIGYFPFLFPIFIFSVWQETLRIRSIYSK